MSKIEFNINDWRKKHVLKEGIGGVVSRRAFDPIPGMFRTEAVDYVDDEEAATDYSDLEDKDLDNDGDTGSAEDKYLHKRQGQVAKVTEDDIFEDDCDICEDDIFENDDLPMDKMDSAEMEPFREEAPSDEEDMDAIMHDAPDRYSESFNIREWQKKFYGNKRNMKWG